MKSGDITVFSQCNDLYASDEKVGDDDIGLAGSLGLPADVTGEVELHQHDSDTENEKEESRKQKN